MLRIWYSYNEFHKKKTNFVVYQYMNDIPCEFYESPEIQDSKFESQYLKFEIQYPN